MPSSKLRSHTSSKKQRTKIVELRAANKEIEHLGKQVYAPEEDADCVNEEHGHFREEAAEREALEALASATKDVCPSTITSSRA